MLPDNLKSVDSVLISHAHQDHYGLIDQMPADVPIYIGKLGEKFIQASRLFREKKVFNNQFRNFNPWETFQIGSLEIKPYPVDHSAADAYAFLIQGEGKSIFYSGDFRAHGRKAKLFDHLMSNPPGPIDILLMESTMLKRPNGLPQICSSSWKQFNVSQPSSANNLIAGCSTKAFFE